MRADVGPHVLELFPEELHSWLAEQGVESQPEHCRRVMAQFIRLGRDRVRPVKRAMPYRVADLVEGPALRRDRPEIVERVEDATDGFVKYLLRSPDGANHEAVRIPLHKPDTYSICLSSQVGCAMGCQFCATGRLGLTRNLEAWEMVGAFLAVRDEAPGRVTGAVFQGQGEPLHNYDAVIRAAKILCHPCGGSIAAKAITISTVGLVPQIRRFTREGHPFRLIVSMTSALPERRRELLPVAARFSMDDLVAALREHAEASQFGLQTVAWVVLGGVNDGDDEVAALAERLAGLPLRFNLIPVNDDRPDGFSATDEQVTDLMRRLQILKAPIVRRYSGGRGRHAACGMLANERSD